MGAFKVLVHRSLKSGKAHLLSLTAVYRMKKIQKLLLAVGLAVYILVLHQYLMVPEPKVNVTPKPDLSSDRARFPEKYTHWSGLDNNMYKNNKPLELEEVAELTQSLHRKLLDAESTKSIGEPSRSCSELFIENYSDTCNTTAPGTCLATTIPSSPRERVESLVLSEYLPESYERVLEGMRADVKGQYEFLVVTATSSNHYLESQKMLKVFHNMVYPLFKNFTLVMVDMGLSPEERRQMEKHCRCQVVTFPFEKLPKHVSEMKCYAWKPFIVAAMFEKAEVVMWADSSTRFNDTRYIKPLIKRTKIRGVQVRGDSRRDMARNPFHTVPMMFEAYGDSPCAHMPFRQLEANFITLHREPLMRRAVVQPWVACAARSDCMCPPNYMATLPCLFGINPFTRHIGFCNRFDQSALAIVMEKLFGDKLYHFTPDMEHFEQTVREDKAKYFKELGG